VHQLIRARDAVLVTSGEEVLEAVGPMGSYALSEPREAEHPRDRLEPRQRQVLDAVPLVQAVDSRKIAQTAGIAHTRTKEALLVLLRAGLVEHSLGRWRVAADPALDEQGNGWAP
jgi:DNA processing protein